MAQFHVYGPNCLNSRGQIVFGYALTDGAQGIAMATPHPVLQTSPVSGAMKLSWPDIVPEFHLHPTDSLSPPDWTDSTNEVAQTNGEFTVTVGNHRGSRFFRLSQ